MRHPIISVILPFFNAANTLERAAVSILDQTLQEFELLLIDNGSTDSSTAIAERLARDEKVTLLTEPQRGVVFASNRGLMNSQALYIARMDADDVAHPDRLALQKAYLDSDPKTGIVATCVKYEGKAANEGFRQFVDWSNSILSPAEIDLNRFVEMPVVNPTLMFRRSIVDKLGWYTEGAYPEDYELILRYLRQGVVISKLPEALLTWHDSPHRLTRKDPRYSTESFYDIKSQYLASWLEEHNPYHPDVWIWGAGKLSRRRSAKLGDHGVVTRGYIDVKARDVKPECIHFEDLPTAGGRFVLSYVGNRGKKTEIRAFLQARGYREGRDFILAA